MTRERRRYAASRSRRGRIASASLRPSPHDPDFELRRVPEHHGADHVVEGLDRRAARRDDEVALAQPGGRGRGVRDDLEDADGPCSPELTRERGLEVLAARGDAEERPDHAALVDGTDATHPAVWAGTANPMPWPRGASRS